MNWRDQLRINNKRTRRVIALFVLIYLVIGFLIDIVIHDHPVLSSSGAYEIYPSISEIAKALVTFQIIPYATLSMVIVAIISLWVTYLFYDRLMLLGTEYYEITPESARSVKEKQLYNVVEEMKVAAGLNFMPRVFLIDADYMNAFATGYSERSALVAITRGLFEKLDRDELQAVMAHELSHIRHSDIKLTLMASMLSNLMLIAIDILFYNVIFERNDQGQRRTDARLVMIIMFLRYVLPFLTVLLMLYLSRTREYMADAGCVELMRNNEPLAKALIKINEDHLANKEAYSMAYAATPNEDVRRAAYLYDPLQAGIEKVNSLADMFSTHPSIQARLAALGYKS